MRDDYERRVASALGATLTPDPDQLPILTWPDGFGAEVSVGDGEPDWIEAYFSPLSPPSGEEYPNELVGRRYGEFLRAVQDCARAAERGVLVEWESRSEWSHILDHLGFRVSQRTIDDNEFWGEEFDDADYEWRPE